MERIGVIGSGTWGTAIAILLSHNGHEVMLWSAIPSEIEELEKTRRHPETNAPKRASDDSSHGRCFSRTRSAARPDKRHGSSEDEARACRGVGKRLVPSVL